MYLAKKKTLFDRAVAIIAVISCVIALLEGCFYYEPSYNNVIVVLVHAIQNALKAFVFQSAISAGDAYTTLTGVVNPIKLMIGYSYIAVVLIAPACTATAIYRTAEILLHRVIHLPKSKKKNAIVLFGYNDMVLNILKNLTPEQKKNHELMVFAGNAISEEEALKVLRFGALWLSFENMKKDVIVKEIKKRVFDYQSCDLVFLEEATATNLNLYFALSSCLAAMPNPPKARFYCACQDHYGKVLLDHFLTENKTSTFDLHVFHTNELLLQHVFSKHPIHQYQEEHGWKDKDVHMLIVGLGELGTKACLSAINQAVLASNSTITIDIIDQQISKKIGFLTKYFREDYVTIQQNEMFIGSDKADGCLRIRFFEGDVHQASFTSVLKQSSEISPFTYGLITIDNETTALQALVDIEETLIQRCGHTPFPLGVLLDKQSEFNDRITQLYPSSFAYHLPSQEVLLDDILLDQRREQILDFNWVYNQIQLSDQAQTTSWNDGSFEQKEKAWQKMQPFQRQSTQLLFLHQAVKLALIQGEQHQEALYKAISNEGTILRQNNNTWQMSGDDQVFLDLLDSHPIIDEWIQLEHRRWCYAMATLGWSYTDGKKDTQRQVNPCMCPWEKLVQTKPDMCKYDLMPYMSALIHFQKQ